jgi:PAS domain S-box-containing protein
MDASGDDFVERFRESEQRLQDILDNAPAVVYVKNLEGRYVLINRHYEERHHVGRAEAVGKTDHQIFPKEVADEFRSNDELVLGTGRSVEVEESVPQADGTRTYISLKFPLRDADGTIYAVCSISTDITARKRTEEEIETRVRQQAVVAALGLKGLAKDNLQALMDEAVECVARTLEVEYAKVAELLPGGNELLLRAGAGWREGLVGHAREETGHGSQAGYTLLSDEPVIADDLRAETRFRPPPLLLEHGAVSSMTVIIHSHDRPFGVLGAHTRERRTFSGDDVNFLQAVANVLGTAIERKRVEEALREIRDAERHRIARDLHDGPLQDLSYGLAEVHLTVMNLEDPESAAPLSRASEALRRASRGLRAAVNNLRLGEEQNWPLPALVESLVERSRRMDPACDIRLEVQEEFPATSTAPMGDVDTGMSRVIQEALTNARRHSGARNVRVSLRVEEGDLVAEVADDGRGFGEESDPGVGMSSMRERALRLGGELEVESAPGEGTRVRLRVPMHDASRDATRNERRRG